MELLLILYVLKSVTIIPMWVWILAWVRYAVLILSALEKKYKEL